MLLTPFRTKRITGLEPFGTSSLADFRDEMNRLFEGFLGRASLPAAWQAGGEPGEWLPAIDVSETDTQIQVRAELPGIDPADVDVNVSEDRLVISGEKKSTKTETGNGFSHREIRCGSFSRSIALPEPVDPAKVSARYDKGMLTVELTKSPTSTSRKVPIQAK
jgi:HSP20 family protein